MSSTTKKAPIDKNSKEYIDSLQTTEQMFRALSDYERMIKEENDSKKRRFADEISRMGTQYIEQIDEKHETRENERLDMIDYIIENTQEKIVKSKVLYDMTYEEVQSIYVRAKDVKKPWYRLLIEYFMGW